MPNTTNIPLNIFFEHGFSISKTSENGTIFLSRDKDFQEPPIQSKEEEFFYYNTKTGKVIDSVTLNATDNGKPLQYPFAVQKGDICFIKDWASGEFVRVNFLPQYIPLVAFRRSEVFCTAHMKWEEYSAEGKTACGCALKGYPVNIRDNSEIPEVYGFLLSVDAEAETIIKIKYIYLDENSLTVKVDERNIKTSEAKHDTKTAFCHFRANKCALPSPVYDAVIRILLSYIKKRYGINIEYKNFAENQNYITAIFESPYEPSLYLLQKVIPEIREIDTKEPNCFNALCKKINFNRGERSAVRLMLRSRLFLCFCSLKKWAFLTRTS